MNEENNWYFGIACLVGILVFVGVWLYSMASWGFLLGIMFGWIPATIAAGIAGCLWPILVILVVVFFFMVSNS